MSNMTPDDLIVDAYGTVTPPPEPETDETDTDDVDGESDES